VPFNADWGKTQPYLSGATSRGRFSFRDQKHGMASAWGTVVFTHAIGPYSPIFRVGISSQGDRFVGRNCDWRYVWYRVNLSSNGWNGCKPLEDLQAYLAIKGGRTPVQFSVPISPESLNAGLCNTGELGMEPVPASFWVYCFMSGSLQAARLDICGGGRWGLH
jgi:hypothetical protein